MNNFIDKPERNINHPEAGRENMPAGGESAGMGHSLDYFAIDFRSNEIFERLIPRGQIGTFSDHSGFSRNQLERWRRPVASRDDPTDQNTGRRNPLDIIERVIEIACNRFGVKEAPHLVGVYLAKRYGACWVPQTGWEKQMGRSKQLPLFAGEFGGEVDGR